MRVMLVAGISMRFVAALGPGFEEEAAFAVGR
jgi:hypothetical protein